MQARRRALVAAAVVLAGAFAVPASAVSGSGQPAPTTASSAAAVTPAAGRVTLGPKAVLRPWTGRRDPQAQPGPKQLAYGGGDSAKQGVQLHPAVYLVFWGSQWSKSDPYADYLRRFFAGLYGPGDDWTRIQREFCQGVAVGAITCPRRGAHIGGPTGKSVLKGVWFDDASLAAPDDLVVASTGSDSVAQEALRAAEHFHLTNPAATRNAQILVAEPALFDSPGYGVYCAYHSYVTSSTYGEVVYIDLPHVTDLDTNGTSPAGVSCGQNMVNKGAAGKYDGVSIAAGHEFVESMTDPYVGTGWVDGSGQENADKCAYLTTGPGAMSNLKLRTGTFAVQGAWSNLAQNGQGGCLTHVR